MTALIVLVIILAFYYFLSISENFSFSNRLINYYIKKSNIHGSGIFLKKNVKEGEYLFKAITDKMVVTFPAKYVNHCNIPNTALVYKDNEYYFYAVKDLDANEELTTNYDYTPSFIKKSEKGWTC